MPAEFIPDLHGGDQFDAWFDKLIKDLPCALVPCPDPSCDHGLSDPDEAPGDTLADCEL